MTSFEMIRPPSNQDEKDLSWLLPYLPIKEEDRSKVNLSFESWDDSGGLSGASMRKVLMTWKDEPSVPAKKFVFKNIPPTGTAQSARLGLPREAYFYKYFADVLINQLNITIAYPFYSFGDMKTGEKILLLEDLSDQGVLSSYYFGPASPVNWKKDLEALVSKFPGQRPSVKDLVNDVFQQVARMHRQYWHDRSLFERGGDFLRSTEWFQGRGQESWEASQQMAKDQWKIVKENIANNKTAFTWDPEIVAVVDASLAKTTWDNYQEELKTRSWTLVHGDFHPGNCFWVVSDKPAGEIGKTVLLDWEMVGFGNGPQELSQYAISHLEPAMRREIEEDVLRAYYQTLTGGEGKVNPDQYSYEQCKSEYIYGGFERWVWFLAALPAFCPEPMIEYWHNQMVAFMRDHQITPQTIGIPRV